jgi:hypothetical protein
MLWSVKPGADGGAQLQMRSATGENRRAKLQRCPSPRLPGWGKDGERRYPPANETRPVVARIRKQLTPELSVW